MLYRFGNFTLDDATRQILVKEVAIHLSPKAFDLLAILLTNRSRAVSKAELQQSLWPTTFVEETNLAGLVAEIRRALHDPASNPLFVRTVYGFGYQFIAAVSVDQAAPPASDDRIKFYLLSALGERMLKEGANVLGRAADATMQIDSVGVSRYHARIVVSDAGATLEDLESKNGTYLNGTRIAAAVVLVDGNEIRLGTFVLNFRISSPTSPTVPITRLFHDISTGST